MSDNIHTLGEGGGRSLAGDGSAEPLPEAWANRSSQPRVGRIGGPSTPAAPARGSGRLGTLRDIASQQPSSHSSRRAPDDDDDDDDDDTPRNFFTGGERSGLSVQNPNHGERRGAHHQVRDILRRAAEGSRALAAREANQGGPFTGRGNTLGSDETESTPIPDANDEEEEEDTAVRNITFWRTGFTIQDGPLRSYDDPESAQLLELIQQGLAPPEVLNVRRGQPVELNIARKLDQDYVAPPPGPFAGSGNRLGSPVPAIAQPSSAPPAPQPAAPSTPAVPSSFEVNMAAPTTSIQIRLADGTRLVSRMNLTHTVGDIRRFINASRPGNSSRPYAIQTTLPVKVLDDESQTIEVAGLKNSVVVQRLL